MFRAKNIREFSITMRRKGIKLRGRGLFIMFRLGIFSITLRRRLKKGARMVISVGISIYSASSKFAGTLKNSYVVIKRKSRRRSIRKKLDKGKKIVEGENGEQKDDDGVEMVTIVLKVDMRCVCNGCTKKVIKSIKSFEGVEKTVRDGATPNKIIVVGRRVDLDPVKLREYVALKTKKKVELISPLPKKQPPKEEKKPIVKKQEAPDQVMRTVILKIHLHCDTCISKIAKFVTRYQGVDKDSFRVETDNNQVKVKGTMDVKEFTAYLKQKLKRDVDIVSTDKDDSSQQKDGGEIKEKGGGGSEKKTEGGGAAQKYGHPRASPRQRDGYGHRYENGYNFGPGNGNGYGYNPHGYGVDNVRPYEMFSDENPSGCSTM